jgi:hypothetical protein
MSPGTYDAMSDKHPDGPRLVRVPVCDSLIITYESLRAVIYSVKNNSASGPTGICGTSSIYSFKKNSASGPTGIRMGHLKD